LQGLLMARLDRVQASKEAAQIGAVLGRDFSHDMLAALWPHDAPSLSLALDNLLDAGLLIQREGAEPPLYSFQHVLVQNTAYDSLLRGARQRYHEQVGELLTGRMPELAEAQPELVAHHFSEGRCFERAVPYWLFGGHRAMQRCAHFEAIRHFTRGLQAAGALPESAERTKSELALQALLSVSLMAVRGYAADEVLESYAKARALCEGLTDDSAVFPVLAGLCLFHLVRGDRAPTCDLASLLLEVAERNADDGMRVRAHGGAMVAQYYLGNFTTAQRHAAEIMQRYRAQEHRAQLFLYGDDILIHAFIVDGLSLWFLGFPDRALARMRQAHELAVEINHAFTTSTVHGFGCQMAELRGDIAAGERAAATTITEARAQGFPFWEAVGVVHSGWPALRAGADASAAEARVREGVQLYRATGARTNVTYFLSLAAQACLVMRDGAGCLAAVDEALELADRQLDAYFKPELTRLRAEALRLLGGDSVEVHATFEAAFELAGAASARSIQLRVAMSMLLAATSEELRRSSRERLAQIYSGFTEGFQTADLQAARRLLGI
jgi:predicted ATPase